MEDAVSSAISSLSIEVDATPTSKSILTGAYLPNGAEIGLFLRDEWGSFYEGKSYNNVLYTAEGTADSQTWKVDPSNPIWLNNSKAVGYAYYPRQESGVSLTEIPISNDGTDWMYSVAPATNLNTLNNVAHFQLVHAMTVIRCKVTKRNYSGAGVVHQVGVEGATIAHGATLNLQDATISGFTGVGKEVAKSDLGILGEQPLVVELWAVPVGVESDLAFSLKVDDRLFTLNIGSVNVSPGTIYSYTLTLDGESLALSDMTLSDWVHSSDTALDSEFDVSDYSVDWVTAKTKDGIYAITAEGRALAYEYVSGSSYTGVAFVIKGKAYQVSKYGLQKENGRDYFYWWKDDPVDIPTLNNYSQVSDEYVEGCLPFPNGSYHPSNKKDYMDGDWTKWAGFDPLRSSLSDFKGKENTEKIIAAQTVEGEVLENTATQQLMNFRNDETRNEGYQDWFIPACGELAFMFRNKDEMNDLIRRIGGESHDSGITFTSTEFNGHGVACVYFTSGYVFSQNKIAQQRFRFIREL